MHPAILGALVGLGLAAAMFAVDYFQMRGRVAEREAKTKRRQEFSGDERKHLGSVFRFCLILPPVMALLFWAGSKILS